MQVREQQVHLGRRVVGHRRAERHACRCPRRARALHRCRGAPRRRTCCRRSAPCRRRARRASRGSPRSRASISPARVAAARRRRPARRRSRRRASRLRCRTAGTRWLPRRGGRRRSRSRRAAGAPGAARRTRCPTGEVAAPQLAAVGVAELEDLAELLARDLAELGEPAADELLGGVVVEDERALGVHEEHGRREVRRQLPGQDQLEALLPRSLHGRDATGPSRPPPRPLLGWPISTP